MQKLSHNREFRFCDEPGTRHQIGKGGFGIVYRGVHVTSGVAIAVKKIRLATGVHRERVRAEIEHSRACSGHPHVVELMHSEITNRHGYLFFGFCKGGSLGELVRSLGPRPEDFARTVLVQLVNALDYIHGLGLVHRDVKPGNVFLDEPECDHRKVHVRLGDFGLARKHAPDRADPQAAMMNTFCGSPMFMAPEILSRQTYGRDVDYFGLGAVVFFVVTGAPPYNSRRLDQLIDDVKLGKVKRPKYPDTLSAPARDIIDRMLVAKPSLRIESSHIVEHPFITQIEPRPPTPAAAAAPDDGAMSFVVVDRKFVDINEASVPIWRRDSPEAAERIELYEAYNRAVMANLYSPYRAMVVVHRLLGLLRASIDFFKDNAGGNQMAAFQRIYNDTVSRIEGIRDQAKHCAAFGVQPPTSDRIPSAEEVIYMHAVRIAADGATSERNQEPGTAAPLYKDCILLLRNLRHTAANDLDDTTADDLVRLDDMIAQSLQRLSVIESVANVRCRRCGGEMMSHHRYCPQCGLRKDGVDASLTTDTVLDMSSLE